MTVAAAALLGITAPLAAQASIVSPAEFAAVSSPHISALPFGWTTSDFRYLSVHDDLAGTPRAIWSFALRRAGANHPLAAPITVALDGHMSTATTTSATVLAHFASNHGLDWVHVIRGRTLNLPGTRTGLLPNPFSYVIPLDGPFIFGGTGPLCWDVHITSQSTSGTTYFAAAWGAEPEPRLAYSVYGDGCRGAGQFWPFQLGGDSEVDWSTGQGTLLVNPMNGPPGAPVVCILGASAASYGGVSLPLALPGTGGGSDVCWLNCDVLATVAGTIAWHGSTLLRVPVPLRPWLGGRHFYAQAAAFDPAANALGLITSNGGDYEFPRPTGTPPVGSVYGSLLLPTGNARPSRGLVVQFSGF